MKLSTVEKIYIIEFLGRYVLPEYMPQDLKKQRRLITMQDDLSGIIKEKTKDKNEIKRMIKTYIEDSLRFYVESFNISMEEVYNIDIDGVFPSTEKNIVSVEKSDLGRYEVSRHFGVITTDEIKATYIGGAGNFLYNGKRGISIPNYVFDDIKEGKNNKYFKLYNTEVYNPPYYSQHYLVEPYRIPNNGYVELPIEPIPYDKNFVDREVNLIYKARENQR
ncbi:hypothetical protein HDR60_05355 [bacterium]|nr:hypothetical protein [bacterium]